MRDSVSVIINGLYLAACYCLSVVIQVVSQGVCGQLDTRVLTKATEQLNLDIK